MKKTRLILIAITTLIISILMTGCSIGDLHFYVSSTSGIGNVFKIGPNACSKTEFRTYLANYKNLYGTFQDSSIWSEDNGKIIEDGMKSAILDHLTRVYSLDLYAKDNNIKLTKSEEEAVNKAAEEYYNSLSDEDRSYTGASKADIEDMYEHYALAEKVYFQLMNSVDEEVSEDEARMMEAEVLFTTKKANADAAATQLKQGYSFASVAQQYSEADSVNVTFGRDKYPKEVDAVVFNLENGQVTDMITTDDGYYFFRCTNKYNKELSEENKANVISHRKDELVQDLIHEQEEKYYSHLSEGTLENLSLEDTENVKTDSFFQVLNKYVSFK